MNQPVAVLDADVLVPVLVCDFLLSMFDADPLPAGGQPNDPGGGRRKPDR
jgi:hypothetical protein